MISILSLSAFALSLCPAPAAQEAAQESDYYKVDYLTLPTDEVLEIGGMDFLPDGRLVLSTRRGQVWIVDNPLAADPAQAGFHLFAEGLQEGLGLRVFQGSIYIVQRSELSRLVDFDNDGLCDQIDTISNDWGVSGNYHEFAFGLPMDERYRFYVSLNVAFFSPKWWHGKSPEPYRGWVLRIEKDGKATPFASGFRSPCGMGQNAVGDIFVTDNQGDWMASSPIFHLQQGKFYGHPASLDWSEGYRSTQTLASDTVPPAVERTPPAIWIPYKWSRSTGNLVNDGSGGQFGPFGGQMFVAELTNGMVLRAMLEKVQGEYQGAVVPFRQKVGSVCRVAFAPDGTLFTGFTNRGWGGLPPAHGVARIRWTGKLPMEFHKVHLLQDGFEITFTQPVASDVELGPQNINLIDYDYDYWWEYGSPERDITKLNATSVSLSADRMTLTVKADLVPARVARMIVSGVRAQNGAALLHDEFAYTINQMPEGERSARLVAKLVAPPPPRSTGEEGWMRLTYGDALDAWNASGWELCDAELDTNDLTKIVTKPGVNALVNTGEKPSHFISKYEFGDCELHIEFMLPKRGNSGVYLMGRYEVQLLDSSDVKEPGPGDCGGIYAGKGWAGKGPAVNAFRGPGLWHKLDIRFTAPRFDDQGNKVSDAVFENVKIDNRLLHKKLLVPGPTTGAMFGDEAATGPLMLQGDHGPVAFGNVRIKPLGGGEPIAKEGWVKIFNGNNLDGWKISDDGEWLVTNGVISGGGGRSHLFSPRDDYTDFEVRAKVRVGENSNSGLYFRTTYGAGWPAGYEAQINSSFPDPQKSGSLYSLAPIKVQLIPPDTWFDYRVRCVDVDAGTHIKIWMNGILVTDHVDTQRRHGKGHIALQQHHEGSVVQVKDFYVRELN